MNNFWKTPTKQIVGFGVRGVAKEPGVLIARPPKAAHVLQQP